MTWQSPSVTILVLQYLKQMPKQPRTPQCPLLSFLGTVYIYSAPLSYYLHLSFLTSFFWETCTVDKGPTMLNSHLTSFRPESDRCEAELLFFQKIVQMIEFQALLPCGRCCLFQKRVKLSLLSDSTECRLHVTECSRTSLHQSQMSCQVPTYSAII